MNAPDTFRSLAFLSQNQAFRDKMDCTRAHSRTPGLLTLRYADVFLHPTLCTSVLVVVEKPSAARNREEDTSKIIFMPSHTLRGGKKIFHSFLLACQPTAACSLSAKAHLAFREESNNRSVNSVHSSKRPAIPSLSALSVSPVFSSHQETKTRKGSRERGFLFSFCFFFVLLFLLIGWHGGPDALCTTRCIYVEK